MSPQTSVNVLWAVWYVTWLGAVVLSGRTQTQMKTDMGGLHRYLSAIGALLLFWPSHDPASGGAVGLASLSSRLWPRSARAEWSLFVIVLLAFSFCWWARLHLGKLWSGFVTLKDDHRIIDTGPYGLVRHPIYTGVIFAALATAVMRASPLALLGWGLVAVGFAMTAAIEEGFLSEHLGAVAYGDYRRRVGMLAPRLW